MYMESSCSRALWGASTVRPYAGGAADAQWLEQLSALIGEYERPTRSASYDGRGGRSHQITHAGLVGMWVGLPCLPTCQRPIVGRWM